MFLRLKHIIGHSCSIFTSLLHNILLCDCNIICLATVLLMDTELSLVSSDHLRISGAVSIKNIYISSFLSPGPTDKRFSGYGPKREVPGPSQCSLLEDNAKPFSKVVIPSYTPITSSLYLFSTQCLLSQTLFLFNFRLILIFTTASEN